MRAGYRTRGEGCSTGSGAPAQRVDSPPAARNHPESDAPEAWRRGWVLRSCKGSAWRNSEPRVRRSRIQQARRKGASLLLPEELVPFARISRSPAIPSRAGAAKSAIHTALATNCAERPSLAHGRDSRLLRLLPCERNRGSVQALRGHSTEYDKHLSQKKSRHPSEAGRRLNPDQAREVRGNP